MKLLDPLECQSLRLSTFEGISESFAIDFDLGAVKMLIVTFIAMTVMVLLMML